MSAHLLLCVMLAIPLKVLSAVANSLSGQHLRVLAMEFPVSFESKRNATGHIVACDGIQKHMMEALSQMQNFSFSYLPFVALLPDDRASARGGISYLMKNEADFYLSSVLLNPANLQKVDFTCAWCFWAFSTLLQYPKETVNLTASFEPFSYEVWILIAISALATVLCLKLLLGDYLSYKNNTEINGRKEKGAVSRESVIPYVMGNLVSQGQRYFPKRLAVRITAGAWCCAAFFLVQTYSSTLTSHLMSPNQKLLINSFFDIVDTPGIILTIDKGYALDGIMRITEGVHLKQFVNTLKKDNRLVTCNITSDCVDYVNSGNVAYSAPANSLSLIMTADLKKTDTCRFTRTKETFWRLPVYSMLRKNSPHTESMNIGILRLQEAGLLAQWENWYVPSTSKCMKINQRNGMPRLSLKHLSSPFFILAVGCFISLTAFIAENIVKKLIRFYHISRIVVV